MGELQPSPSTSQRFGRRPSEIESYINSYYCRGSGSQLQDTSTDRCRYASTVSPLGLQVSYQNNHERNEWSYDGKIVWSSGWFFVILVNLQSLMSGATQDKTKRCHCVPAPASDKCSFFFFPGKTNIVLPQLQ